MQYALEIWKNYVHLIQLYFGYNLKFSGLLVDFPKLQLIDCFYVKWAIQVLYFWIIWPLGWVYWRKGWANYSWHHTSQESWSQTFITQISWFKASRKTNKTGGIIQTGWDSSSPGKPNIWNWKSEHKPTWTKTYISAKTGSFH